MKKINRVYNTFKVFRKEQLFLCFLIIVNILLTAYIPLQVKNLINAITAGQDWQLVLHSGMIIIAVTLVNMGVDLFQNYRWHRLRYQAINFLRLKMFGSALKKPIKFFQKHSVGEIIAKTLDDVTTVAQQGAIGQAMLFSNLFQVIVSLTLLFFLQVKLAIVVLLFIPTYYILFNLINYRLQESSGKERIHYSKVMKDAQEKILGVRTIKIFKRENYMINTFSKVLDNHLFYVCKNLFYYVCGNGISGLIISILPVVILLYGGYLVFQKDISLGAFIAFYTYLGYLYEPIKNLSDYHLMLQNTLGMCDRVLGFMDKDDEEDKGTLEIKDFTGLEFKNVNFAYQDNKPALSDINFKIEKGDRVLIVGQSGSGKSTLLNLIMKLYSPETGEIILNDHDLNQIKKDSLYSHITLLEQNHFLFDGSIEDNITFGTDVNIDRVKNVANLANLTPLIKNNPEGFKRQISELGLNLSGGERQRICLARTLIHESDLVLLDEATSALDSTIENEIVTNLNKYLDGKTLVAVSHRPALLGICNKLIHLEDGKMVGYYDLNNSPEYEKASKIISQTA